MLNAAGVEESTRFLDVGCGGGGASVLAAERGAQISGLDAAEGLLYLALLWFLFLPPTLCKC